MFLIVNVVFLCTGKEPEVIQELLKGRDIKGKNNIGVTIPPSKRSFLR